MSASKASCYSVAKTILGKFTVEIVDEMTAGARLMPTRLNDDQITISFELSATPWTATILISHFNQIFVAINR